ncbi:MAG: helix-turn-helix domain-containing protein, partial [Daejeonella sp.]
ICLSKTFYLMIGPIIKKYRKLKGYSGTDMAFKLGISQNAYSKIELSRTRVTIERLIEISTILNIPVTVKIGDDHLD